MSAFQVLREFLLARGSFVEQELAVEELMLPRTLTANEFLQRAGDVSQCSEPA